MLPTSGSHFGEFTITNTFAYRTHLNKDHIAGNHYIRYRFEWLLQPTESRLIYYQRPIGLSTRKHPPKQWICLLSKSCL